MSEGMKGPTGRKRGGPEKCPKPCSDCDERHHFGEYFGFKEDPTADADDTSTGPDHPAAKLGLEAWQNCKHCDAWQEMLDGDTDEGDKDFDDYDPRDWA